MNGSVPFLCVCSLGDGNVVGSAPGRECARQGKTSEQLSPLSTCGPEYLNKTAWNLECRSNVFQYIIPLIPFSTQRALLPNEVPHSCTEGRLSLHQGYVLKRDCDSVIMMYASWLLPWMSEYSASGRRSRADPHSDTRCPCPASGY